MGLEWLSFFFRFSVVFALCLCFCALSFSFLFYFPPFPFSAFLRFSLFFFAFTCLKDLCFLHISRQLLSIVPQSSATGKLQNPKKRKFRSDPVYTHPVRNFPSDAPFSRLRPNDPSSRLTNDTREDPITASHGPIANRNSPKIFWCNVSAQHSKINYFRIFWWM